MDFPDLEHSKEELVAEMGASFLSSYSQIYYDSVVQNNASYLEGWLKVKEEDSRLCGSTESWGLHIKYRVCEIGGLSSIKKLYK